MHILITGANGFIGRHLVKRLIEKPASTGVSRITALDPGLDLVPDHALVHKIPGSFADSALLEQALAESPADIAFHLASVPSGLAESNHELGTAVNIHGTQALLERLKAQGNCPTVVFASSIAVYGKPSVAQVNDDTLPTPNLSYGSQKVIGEVLVADYHRRGWISGTSVRIPGIVARPPEPNGAVSIFFSDLIRRLASGESFTCPVSAGAKSWLMSVPCCVDNLLLAGMTGKQMKGRRTWTLPALHIAIEELVSEISKLFPARDMQSLISYAPDPWVEENFGSYPPLHCPKAEAAGFHHDGSPAALVSNALAGMRA